MSDFASGERGCWSSCYSGVAPLVVGLLPGIPGRLARREGTGNVQIREVEAISGKRPEFRPLPATLAPNADGMHERGGRATRRADPDDEAAVRSGGVELKRL
jgi:hypothetical protein